MIKILYISLTGMTEPLGQSQVLEYLIELSKNNKIYLISFERKTELKNVEKIRKIVEQNNISWNYLIYSNKFGLFSSIFQINLFYKNSKQIIKKENINIIHSRSFIPAIVGNLLKKKFKIKHLFDIRGFWIDEKIDRERLKSSSLIYKILKKIDNNLYKKSDHIVTLTHKAKEILSKNLYLEKEKITVIPTCASKKTFKIMNHDEKIEFKRKLGFNKEDIIFIHTGTVSGWYDFDKELFLMKNLMTKNKFVKFLILNKNEINFINKKLQDFQIDKNRVIVTQSSFENVYKYLNISNFSLFFIKPRFSKQASAPTKFAENIACYLPSITNKNVGDMEFYLNKYKVGLLCDLEQFKSEKYINELSHIILDNIENFQNKTEFDSLFNEHFDKRKAIKMYDSIYKRLCNE